MSRPHRRDRRDRAGMPRCRRRDRSSCTKQRRPSRTGPFRVARADLPQRVRSSPGWPARCTAGSFRCTHHRSRRRRHSGWSCIHRRPRRVGLGASIHRQRPYRRPRPRLSSCRRLARRYSHRQRLVRHQKSVHPHPVRLAHSRHRDRSTSGHPSRRGGTGCHRGSRGCPRSLGWAL